MTNTHETIADIIAEMRNEGHTGESSCLEWVGTKMLYYADRLEAAHKREVGVAKSATTTGDAAKMREALVSVKKSIDEMGAASLDGDPEIMLMSLTQVCARLSARIEAALAQEGGNNG